MTAFGAHAAVDTLDDLSIAPPHRIRPGVMAQRWEDLAFISWPFDAGDVQRLVPAGLEIDTFDGAAWVSVIPFRLSIRLSGTPTVPWASRFSEINVRTYVRGPDGHRGIWFLSLDASRLGAVVMARHTYRLPYMWARMQTRRSGGRVRYRGSRRWPGPGASWDLAVDVGGLMTTPDDLQRFLTARWRLYSPAPLVLPARTVGLRSTTVDHPPWPLHHARLAQGTESLLAQAGLPATTAPPTVAFSAGVSVRFDRAVPAVGQDPGPVPSVATCLSRS
jgi:uncharacterized protein YqjF (DUF2071 family)